MDTNFSNKIISCADVHISQNHFKYIKNPLEFFVETVKKERPLITIVDGDYFDDRINADEDIYHFAINQLLIISQYTKYLIVVDGTYSHDYDTLDILNSFKEYVPNILYIKKKEVLDLDGLKILILPEEYPTNPEEYYKDVLADTYDYVFGHGDIEGGVYHSGIQNSLLKGFRFKKSILAEMAKYIVFGHLHKHQFLGSKENILYIGSLARYKFGEEEDKGFICINNIFDEKPTLEFIKTPSHSFDTIKLDENLDVDLFVEQINTSDKIKFKIDKCEGLSQELIQKLIEADLYSNNDITIERINNKDIDDTELEYEDIENLDVKEQYKFMLQRDIEGKKIRVKDQSFLTGVVLESYIENIMSEISIEKKKEEMNE